jgi:hypothetical protein
MTSVSALLQFADALCRDPNLLLGLPGAAKPWPARANPTGTTMLVAEDQADGGVENREETQ